MAGVPREKLLRGLKFSGVIKREHTDMTMYIRRLHLHTSRWTRIFAETSQSAGGRIEPGYSPLNHGIGVTPEYNENRDRRAAMLAAALAMAPRHPLWFATGDKSHRPTKAPTLSLAAHLAFLPRGH